MAKERGAALLDSFLGVRIYDNQDEPDKMASEIVSAINDGLDKTFDHDRFDRSGEKAAYRICLLNGIMNRLKGRLHETKSSPRTNE